MTTHDSSKWTGHTDAELERRYPQPQGSLPPIRVAAVKGAMTLALSQAALWLAWQGLQMAIGDLIVSDNRHWLVIWAVAMIGLALFEMRSESDRWARARTSLVRLATGLTFLVAAAYLLVGIMAHSSARIGQPERALQFAQTSGRWPFRATTYWHIRASDPAATKAQSHTCVLIQSVTGNLGFRWIRVVDVSRGAGRGQLNWPITGAECFSALPLSWLPR